MYDAGLDVEGAKGECNFGQHEIGFLYADAMTTADNHGVYKTVAKEIAAQQGKSLTFMAKYNEREGSSCHIHLSLRGTDGALVFWDAEQKARTAALRPLRRRRAGHRSPTSRCSTRPTSTPTSGSPPARSRRPRSRGAATTAPARCGWSVTAPAPGWRTGCPGRTSNPYLALAAMLAGGLHGIEQELPLEDELVGNAYDSDQPQVPHTLAEARERFAVVRAGPGRLRRRGRRPLHQHGRRRAGGVRRRGHRLGAAPRIRATVSDDLHRHQPGHRAGR